MPLVEVTLGAGRTPAQVRALIHEVHEAVARTVEIRAIGFMRLLPLAARW